MKSRRSFLKLMATGSAAVITGAAAVSRAKAAPAKSTRARAASAPAPAPPTAAIAAEIRKQKDATAATLKTIRSYVLPPGSEPAFVFAPMSASPRSRRRRGTS